LADLQNLNLAAITRGGFSGSKDVGLDQRRDTTAEFLASVDSNWRNSRTKAGAQTGITGIASLI
jgi:hypothetical protein